MLITVYLLRCIVEFVLSEEIRILRAFIFVFTLVLFIQFIQFIINLIHGYPFPSF